jgi:hypothetical protein
MRVYFDQHALCGVNVDLQEAGFVERGIKEGKEALRCVVWFEGRCRVLRFAL